MLEGKGLARTSWKAYVGKPLYSTLNQSRKAAQDSWPGHAWVYEAGEGMESGTRAFFAGALRRGREEAGGKQEDSQEWLSHAQASRNWKVEIRNGK